MTPIYKTPAHVDHFDYGNEGDKEEHYSNVFHRDHPGRIVAVFYGDNHRENSEEFCAWAQTQQSVEAAKPTSPVSVRQDAPTSDAEGPR